MPRGVTAVGRGSALMAPSERTSIPRCHRLCACAVTATGTGAEQPLFRLRSQWLVHPLWHLQQRQLRAAFQGGSCCSLGSGPARVRARCAGSFHSFCAGGAPCRVGSRISPDPLRDPVLELASDQPCISRLRPGPSASSSSSLGAGPAPSRPRRHFGGSPRCHSRFPALFSGGFPVGPRRLEHRLGSV